VDVVGLDSLQLNVLVGLGNLLATAAGGGTAAQGKLSARVGVLMEGHIYKNIYCLEPILRKTMNCITLRVGLLADLRVCKILSTKRECQIYHTYPWGGGPEGAP